MHKYLLVWFLHCWFSSVSCSSHVSSLTDKTKWRRRKKKTERKKEDKEKKQEDLPPDLILIAQKVCL